MTDIRMPGALDGIDVARALNAERLVPVVLLSAFHDPPLLARAEDAPILSDLIKPIGRAQLRTTLAIARRRRQEMAALHAESASLRQALEDRKIVERAKGILMRRAQLDEPGRVPSIATDRAQREQDPRRGRPDDPRCRGSLQRRRPLNA